MDIFLRKPYINRSNINVIWKHYVFFQHDRFENSYKNIVVNCLICFIRFKLIRQSIKRFSCSDTFQSRISQKILKKCILPMIILLKQIYDLYYDNALLWNH